MVALPRFWIQDPWECVIRQKSRYHHGNHQHLGSVTSPCGPAQCGLRGRKPGSQRWGRASPRRCRGPRAPQGFVPLFWAGPSECRAVRLSAVPRNRCVWPPGEVGGRRPCGGRVARLQVGAPSLLQPGRAVRSLITFCFL